MARDQRLQHGRRENTLATSVSLIGFRYSAISLTIIISVCSPESLAIASCIVDAAFLQMIKEKMRDIYLGAGINLTLLDGKRPTVAAWQNRKIPKERVKAHKGNLTKSVSPNTHPKLPL
jgi:hypothetical protein